MGARSKQPTSPCAYGRSCGPFLDPGHRSLILTLSFSDARGYLVTFHHRRSIRPFPSPVPAHECRVVGFRLQQGLGNLETKKEKSERQRKEKKSPFLWTTVKAQICSSLKKCELHVCLQENNITIDSNGTCSRLRDPLRYPWKVSDL